MDQEPRNYTPTYQTPAETENPQLVLSWKAPLRAYKKRGKNVLRFYIALAILLSVLVVFFGDRILLLPIWAVLFLFYILTITPPPDIENKITTFGIETAGITLRWETLSHFYFTKRFGFNVLTIVSQPPYYLHSYLIVPDEELKQKLITILAEHLVYQETPDRNMTDRVIDWLSQLIPDDDEEEPAAEVKKDNPSSFSQTHSPASL